MKEKGQHHIIWGVVFCLCAIQFLSSVSDTFSSFSALFDTIIGLIGCIYSAYRTIRG